MIAVCDRISSDPAICGGKPCIKGTRTRVHDVLSLLAAAASRQEILDDYPYITNEDITAALEYAQSYLERHPEAAERRC